MNWQSIVNAGAGLLGAFITFAFGHWTESLTFLLTVIGIDIISGGYASVHEGRGLNSAVGAAGLAKKGLMLLVIILSYRVDVLLGSEVVMGAAIYFYIANELVSVTENYGRIGLPMPDKLRQIIAVLKQKGEA
ncbi:holin family protein [Cohnella sp. AR92]|uniref:phage holin family protein n=1 Tax=Cohnella sp. AR92 TaxID=648716 RepID=UPI001EE13794|nr:phage holin family protein [Cohnella sp. AR92]